MVDGFQQAEFQTQALAPEQITLNPDCGFAPTSIDPILLEEAYQKLKAMSDAAEILRQRYA